MQSDPEKTINNYNEFEGVKPLNNSLLHRVELHQSYEETELIEESIWLVAAKIDEILGKGNRLTNGNVNRPTIRFMDTDPKNTNFAGYFDSSSNEIAVIDSRIHNPLDRQKVLIHEYIHFISHNGRDEHESVDPQSPLALKNNVGFHRNFGLDIREGTETKYTADYFLAFNEAVTEQFAIDILPGAYEAYDDYRGLLNQVIDDFISQGLGSSNNDGLFQPWSRDQTKGYIYTCFFRGDLAGFTQLLRTTYQKYTISEQQFGLMTSKEDLPSIIENNLTISGPDGPQPTPHQIASMVQHRLDLKKLDDYVTDVISPEEDHKQEQQMKYGAEYDTHLKKYGIVSSHKEIIEGKEYETDSLGYFIYHGEESRMLFEEIKSKLDNLLSSAQQGSVDAENISEQMDQLLFQTYYMSMLSDGFRDFYIYKHSKIDNL